MEYNIKLDMRMDVSSLQTLLRVLDAGPHGFVRPLIDDILKQAGEQEAAAKAAGESAPADPAPADPAPAEAVGGTD